MQSTINKATAIRRRLDDVPLLIEMAQEEKDQGAQADAIKELDEVTWQYKNSFILASQRNLQYREEQILRSNARLYNCCSTYIDREEVFKQTLFLLLNGSICKQLSHLSYWLWGLLEQSLKRKK